MTTELAWKPFYSVGEPSLDRQHRQILGIISDLRTAMDHGVGREVMIPLLDRLLQYTDTHFKHEEELMDERSFPNLAEHKAAHAQLRKRTVDLRACTDLITAQDLLRFIKTWWLDHIQGEDKLYAPYLQVPAHA